MQRNRTTTKDGDSTCHPKRPGSDHQQVLIPGTHLRELRDREEIRGDHKRQPQPKCPPMAHDETATCSCRPTEDLVRRDCQRCGPFTGWILWRLLASLLLRQRDLPNRVLVQQHPPPALLLLDEVRLGRPGPLPRPLDGQAAAHWSCCAPSWAWCQCGDCAVLLWPSAPRPAPALPVPSSTARIAPKAG